MHVKQFGRIENMSVCAGEPLNSDVKVVRVARLGALPGPWAGPRTVAGCVHLDAQRRAAREKRLFQAYLTSAGRYGIATYNA